jgi:hypothetical protein
LYNHGLAGRQQGKSGKKISAPSAISCSKNPIPDFEQEDAEDAED